MKHLYFLFMYTLQLSCIIDFVPKLLFKHSVVFSTFYILDIIEYILFITWGHESKARFSYALDANNKISTWIFCFLCLGHENVVLWGKIEHWTITGSCLKKLEANSSIEEIKLPQWVEEILYTALKLWIPFFFCTLSFSIYQHKIKCRK